MIVAISLIGVQEILHAAFGLEAHAVMFWLETVALCAFGYTWLIKGKVMYRDADEKEG